jgi:MFS superfamily sulfate permease-like transporter
LTGVLVGVTLSVLKLLYKATHMNVYIEPSTVHEGHVDLHLEGSATFLRIPMLTAVLDRIPEGSTVHLRTERLHYIDHSCLDLMQDWITNAAGRNIHPVLERDSLERKYWTPATTA